MLLDYLTWYKDIEERVIERSDAHFLMSSAVSEPTDMLVGHIEEFQRDGIRSHLKMSNAWGHVPLLDSLSSRYGVPRNATVTTNGVSNGIYLVCRALLSSGDHVVVESPAYQPLIASPEFIGCRIDSLSRRPPEFRIDPDDLRDTLKPDTTILILSNLYNPSCTLLTNSEIEGIVSVAKEISPGIAVVVDEVYRDLAPGESEMAASIDECVVSLNGLTKSFGLGSIHTGWIIANPKISERVRRLQVLVEGSGSKVNDGIASIVIDRIDEYRERAIAHVSKNRAILRQHMEPLLQNGIISGAIPEYGCIYFPAVSNVDSSDELVETLSNGFNVYVVPGRFFGMPNHIRIGYGGKSDTISADLEALASALTFSRN